MNTNLAFPLTVAFNNKTILNCTYEPRLVCDTHSSGASSWGRVRSQLSLPKGIAVSKRKSLRMNVSQRERQERIRRGRLQVPGCSSSPGEQPAQAPSGPSHRVFRENPG